MAAHRMSQVQVASALKFSSSSRLSTWLGRTRDRVTPATEAEIDAIIAAYLDHEADAAASVNVVPAEAPIPPSAAPSAPAASAGAPRASSAEHAELVRRLEEHMATHSISQARVTEAAKLSCQAKLCMWLGRASSNTLSAEAEAETEVLIAAYLDGNAAAAASADAAPAEAPIPPSAAPAAPAAPAASAGAPRALPAERAQLMRRLE